MYGRIAIRPYKGGDQKGRDQGSGDHEKMVGFVKITSTDLFSSPLSKSLQNQPVALLDLHPAFPHTTSQFRV